MYHTVVIIAVSIQTVSVALTWTLVYYCKITVSHSMCGCCDRKYRAACAQSFAPRQMRHNLSYYCLLAPRICIVVLRAHPVRGELHNQRNTTGEVATVWSKILKFGKGQVQNYMGNTDLKSRRLVAYVWQVVRVQTLQKFMFFSFGQRIDLKY